MKKFLFLLAVPLLMAACTQQSNYSDGTVTVNPVQEIPGDQLNLQAVGELLKTCKDGPEFEKKLNDTTLRINNLDLNKDGNTDYLKVTEYGNGTNKGFSITDELGPNDIQEIATLQFEQNQNQQTNVTSAGNQTVYGANAPCYHSCFSMNDLLIMHWMFSPRPYYISPYHYGYYPTYYRPYRSIPRQQYSTRTVTKTTTTYKSVPRTQTISKISSPNSARQSSTVKSNFSAPTSSQKSYSTRDSKPVNSGGFKNSSSSSSSSRPSSSSSSSRSFSSGGSRSFSSGRRK